MPTIKRRKHQFPKNAHQKNIWHKPLNNKWLWVKHAVTGDDNQTYDSGRLALFYVVFGVVSFVVLVMCGLSIWSTIFNKQPFNPNDLGVGVGGLLGGVAGVLIGVGGYLFGQGRAVSINESSGVTTGTTVQPQTGTITNFTSSGQSSNINMARPIPIVPDTPTGSTGSPDSNDSKQVQIG